MLAVLIVEDDADWILLLKEIIKDLGHELAGVATNTEEAVAAASLVPPDVAIVDIGLAGSMIGVEAAQLLRREHPGLSLIFCTGWSDPVVVEATRALRPTAFLVKPALPGQIRAALSAAESEQRDRPARSRRTPQPKDRP